MQIYIFLISHKVKVNTRRRILDLKSFKPGVVHENCFIGEDNILPCSILVWKNFRRALNVNSWRRKSKKKRAYSGCAKRILNKADLSAPEQGTRRNQRLDNKISFLHPFYYVAVCAFI